MPSASKPQHLFADILARVQQATAAVLGPGADLSRIVVEPPRDPTHGDMATNAAMVLAKEAGKKPRELAESIAAKLRGDDKVTSVDIAGPGFINLTLKPNVWAEELRLVLAGGQRLWPQRHRQRRKSQRRVRLCQSDRAHACRPRPWCGVR